MIKPDERTWKALKDIQQYPDWKIIREWFDKSIQDALMLSVKISDITASRWKQGAAQELLEMTTDIDNAKIVLDRMGKAKEQRPGIV